MYEDLGTVTLKSGAAVDCGVVTTPDAQWAARITSLLGHKGDLWKWHIDRAVGEDLGIDQRFYLLHRDGLPFANTLTVTSRGVGTLGHVFTHPSDRRQHAASLLLERLMNHTRRSNTQMLVLGTGFDSPPYHIYANHGFAGLYPGTGLMAWRRDDAATFEQSWFADGPVAVEPLHWRHWPAANPLLAGAWPRVVRAAGLRVVGPGIGEYCLMTFLHDRTMSDAQPGRARNRDAAVMTTPGGAVVGLACWTLDATWPRTIVVDLFCHPRFERHADELLAKLPLPGKDRFDRAVAYVDANAAAPATALERHGFAPMARLPRWATDLAHGGTAVDVAVLGKTL